MSDMRRFIRLVEGVAESGPDFLAAVRREMDPSWHEDFAEDAVLQAAIRGFLNEIGSDVMQTGLVVWRLEMRPVKIKALKSVGCFWTWNQDSAALYVEDDSLRGLSPITLHTHAEGSDIDWPKSIARNLTNPHECEISIKAPAIHVEGYYDAAGDFRRVGKVVRVV